MTPLELLACAALIMISGFMSAAEVALFSLSRFQLRSLKERFKLAHRRIKKLLGDPAGLLITVLVMNEVLNIAISTLIAEVVARGWGTTAASHGMVRVRDWIAPGVPDWLLQAILGTLITAPVVLLLCEITPKVIAARANQAVAVLGVRPLQFSYELLKPVRFVLSRVTSRVARLIGDPRPGAALAHGEGSPQLLKEEEFLFMVEEGTKEGAVQESELGLIRSVFDLDDTLVSDVYTPMSQVMSLHQHTTIRGALSALRTQRFSRIPVTASDRSQVVGVLYAKDLLLTRVTPEQAAITTISTLMRRPYVVNPGMRLNTLFRRFRQTRTHLAIVESAHGVAIGVVSMADVLDSLFEEVLDEYDPDEEGAG